MKKLVLLIAALLGITLIGQTLTAKPNYIIPVSVSPTPTTVQNVQTIPPTLFPTQAPTTTPTITPTPISKPSIAPLRIRNEDE
jgi:hypothetical protein